MAQIALNWVMTQPGVASVILGATKLEQIKDNLGSTSIFHLKCESVWTR
ncbi:aryl-alcohol dehydrogenase-like predicted oxidoreductase [Sinorhizobium meliloti]